MTARRYRYGAIAWTEAIIATAIGNRRSEIARHLSQADGAIGLRWQHNANANRALDGTLPVRLGWFEQLSRELPPAPQKRSDP
jgi:hypothetical protein